MRAVSLTAVQTALATYPIPCRLDDAAAWLSARRLPVRGALAVERLEALFNDVAILGQYRRLFPAHFATSSCRLERKADECYSPREYEFFDLVERDLFPLDTDSLMMDEERSTQIPIITQGFEPDENDMFVDATLPWQLLMLLFGHVDEEAVAYLQLDATQQRRITRILATRLHRIDGQDLAAACAHLSSPLQYVPVVIRYIQHDGENYFLDPYAEQSLSSLWWTSETVDLLIADWREAQVILQQVAAVIDWLDERPIPHFQEAIALWQSIPPSSAP